MTADGACVDLSPVPGNPITTGLTFTCALLSGGIEKCWGGNQYGMLGNGGTTDSAQPVDVAGIGSALSLAAGGYEACTLTADRNVHCWGDNSGGELGMLSPPFSAMPLPVPGVSDAVAISVGAQFACALLSTGSVSCWGANDQGQVGSGTVGGMPYFMAPASRVVGLTDAIAISAGNDHACALVQNGTVTCWGSNSAGQLGAASASKVSAAPVPVSGVTGAKMVSAGTYSTCALLSDGSVACWGDDRYGQLGDGTDIGDAPYGTPNAVKVSGITDATYVSVGNEYACAVRRDGSVACWGNNQYGTLGAGATASSSSPVPLKGSGNVVTISCGPDHACAQLTGGTFECWGQGSNGQLGNGSPSSSLTPVPVML